MAKTNYSKVEEALTEGMRQMMVQHLHSLADSLSDIDSKNFEDVSIASQKKLIAVLKFELNWIQKQDANFYKKMELSKSEVKKLIEKSEPLTKEDFETIKKVKAKIDEIKLEIEAKTPQTNEELIEKERVKHINKRFNKNDNWLPLH